MDQENNQQIRDVDPVAKSRASDPGEVLADLYNALKSKDPEKTTESDRRMISIIDNAGKLINQVKKIDFSRVAKIGFDVWGLMLEASTVAAKIAGELTREYQTATGKKLKFSDVDPIIFRASQAWITQNVTEKNAKTISQEMTENSIRPYVIAEFQKHFKIKGARDLSTLKSGESLSVASTIDAQTTLFMIENIIADPWKPGKKQKLNEKLKGLKGIEITRGVRYEGAPLKFADGRRGRQVNRLDTREKTKHPKIVNRVTNASIFYSSSGGLAWKFFIMGLAKVKKVYNAKNDELLQREITFSGQEMMNLGMYDSQKGALNGIDIGIEALRAIEILVATPGSDPKIPDWKFIPLFIERGAKDGGKVLTAEINPNFPWKSYLKQYTDLPSYIVKLSNRGAELLGHILLLARQRGAEIKKNGFFTVRLSTVKIWLQIPDPETTNDPKRVIKDPIISAINEIMTYERAGDLIVEIMGNDGESLDPGMKVQKWLDSGILKISVKQSGKIGLKLERAYTKSENKKMRAIRIANSRKKSTGKKIIIIKKGD